MIDDHSQLEVMRSYMDSLQVRVITASYAHTVSKTWGRPVRKDDYFRLYFMVEGQCWIKVDQVELRPIPGQLIILPPDTPLTYSTINSTPFIKHWLHFSVKVDHLHLSQLIQFPYSIQVHDVEYVSGLFRTLTEMYKTRDDLTSPLKAKMFLLEILTYFLDHVPAQSVGLYSSSPSPSNQILKYIEDHIKEPITLEKLAGIFHYHPNYFVRYFRSMFNMTPIQYINRVRIENAKRLLISTDMSIEQVAEDIGLDRYYFSKIFRQLTTLSPSKYRMMHRNAAHNQIADRS